MKTGSGACRSGAPGYTVLGVMLVLFGLTVVSILVATHLFGRFIDRSQRREEGKLKGIRQAFLQSVARTQSIPTYTNWLSVLPPFADLNQTGLNQTHPEWGTDSTLTRAMLVDTNLPPTLLPYQQTAAGLAGTATNLLRTAARVMLVSSTRRGLALPFSSGVLSSNSFNSIWNWVYDPVTKAPPTGWASAWTGFGQHLHVERINLATLFRRITCSNLKYGVAGPASVTNLVTTQTSFYFLYGTSLILANTNGTIKQAYIVTRDATFNYGSVTNAGPILYYTFKETSGSVATNSGSTGASAHGRYTNGVTLGVAGPRSPAYTNYSSSNTGVRFDGVNDYIVGTNGLLNNVSGFTIAGWMNPSTSSLKNLDLFGQEDIAQMGFTSADGKLELWCDAGAKKLHYMYPYGASEWHHIAGVGDGATMHIYVDAVEVASRIYETASFGANSKAFNVGGNVFGSGQYFAGTLDEVIAYNRALSLSELLQLYHNSPP